MRIGNFVFALAVGLVSFLYIGLAQADHNGPWLPGLPTPTMNRQMSQGFQTYCLDSYLSAKAGFRSDANDVAAAGNDALGIPAYEVGCSVANLRYVYPGDTAFDNTCGSGAAGCIVYWADPVYVYVKASLPYLEWRTTIAHEGINYGHAEGEHEQYYDQTFTCKSIADLLTYGPGLTVMSCGTGLWRPEQFDIDTVSAVMFPQQFRGGLLVGNTVFYGGSDSKTTRVAVFYRTYLGYLFFTGQYLPAKVGCTDLVCGAEQLALPLGACTDVFIGHENALPGSWLKGLQRVGGVAC